MTVRAFKKAICFTSLNRYSYRFINIGPIGDGESPNPIYEEENTTHLNGRMQSLIRDYNQTGVLSEWVEKKCEGDVAIIGDSELQFELKKDAMFFKLEWERLYQEMHNKSYNISP
jgi:hypothetical protein